MFLNTNMSLSEKRYMISDAAKMVDVESHVLRYWEEELEIEIPRNEMGHRYYTDYYIEVFKKIKELKEQGFLLKAIKLALPEIMEGKYMESEDTEKNCKTEIYKINTSVRQDNEETSQRLKQFSSILGSVISSAIKENNNELSKEVSGQVSESVIKEMDYLIRVKEEKEEERYKKFDEIVRGLMEDNKSRKSEKNKKKFFVKKNKK